MSILQKKICLLGDFAVGKTSLIRRFVEGRFDDKYLTTIGAKISRKTIKRNTHLLNMLVWDLVGGDDFKDAQANYLRGAVGAIIVCDLTRRDTLDAFERYAAQFKAINPVSHLIFVGNKVDLVTERVISDHDLQRVSHHFGAPYLLTSAKTGEHVESAFLLLADHLEKPKGQL